MFPVSWIRLDCYQGFVGYIPLMVFQHAKRNTNRRVLEFLL